MKKLYDKLLGLIFDRKISVEEGVEYSLEKYETAYKLLEEYDRKAVEDPEELADSQRLRPSIQELQTKTGV